MAALRRRRVAQTDPKRSSAVANARCESPKNRTSSTARVSATLRSLSDLGHFLGEVAVGLLVAGHGALRIVGLGEAVDGAGRRLEPPAHEVDVVLALDRQLPLVSLDDVLDLDDRSGRIVVRIEEELLATGRLAAIRSFDQ